MKYKINDKYNNDNNVLMTILSNFNSKDFIMSSIKHEYIYKILQFLSFCFRYVFLEVKWLKNKLKEKFIFN